MNLTQIRESFKNYFAAKYGRGVGKTAWHFFNWIVQTKFKNLNAEGRAQQRRLLIAKYHTWAREKGVVASWENCARFAKDNNLIKE